MTFDAEQLDSFLLVGAAVTFLAILAVRVSSRAGLPSLLIYLLMGVALGEAGLGIQFEDAELAHALGFAALAVILAEGGLTTSWSEVRPAMRLGVSLATRGRRRVGDRRGRGLALPARPAVGAGDPAGCGHLAHRRGRGVLGAADRAPAPTALGHPRGRVGAQRRPHRRPGHPGLLGRPPGAGRGPDGRHGRPRARPRGGLGPGVRLRRRLDPAPDRAARLGPLPDRRALPGLPRVRRRGRRPRQRLRRDLRRRADPRQQRAPAPGRLPVLRRGHRVAGPDRAVRDARPAALARPDHAVDGRARGGGGPDPHLRRPAALGAGQQRRAADAVARARLHLLGRPARRRPDRAHHDPAGRRGRRGRPGSSTWSS